MKRVGLYNLAAIGGYFGILLGFGYLQDLPRWLFWAVDAQTYFGYSLNSSFSLQKATFLWPLILINLHSLGGSWLVWVFMFGAWLASFNLLLASVERKWIIWIYLANVSIMILTLHAVTETLVILLVCLLIFFEKKGWDNHFFMAMALLAVTKPVYFYLFLFVLVYFIWKRRVSFETFLLGAAIVGFQLILNFIGSKGLTHGISGETFRHCFLAATYGYANGLPVRTAQELTGYFSQAMAMKYVVLHPVAAAAAYLNFFVANMVVTSNFVFQPILRSWVLFWNFVVLGFSFGLLRRDVLREHLVLVVFVGWLVLTCPISMAQGDRLILPVMPVLVYLLGKMSPRITRIIAN